MKLIYCCRVCCTTTYNDIVLSLYSNQHFAFSREFLWFQMAVTLRHSTKECGAYWLTCQIRNRVCKSPKGSDATTTIEVRRWTQNHCPSNCKATFFFHSTKGPCNNYYSHDAKTCQLLVVGCFVVKLWSILTNRTESTSCRDRIYAPLHTFRQLYLVWVKQLVYLIFLPVSVDMSRKWHFSCAGRVHIFCRVCWFVRPTNRLCL